MFYSVSSCLFYTFRNYIDSGSVVRSVAVAFIYLLIMRSFEHHTQNPGTSYALWVVYVVVMLMMI